MGGIGWSGTILFFISAITVVSTHPLLALVLTLIWVLGLATPVSHARHSHKVDWTTRLVISYTFVFSIGIENYKDSYEKENDHNNTHRHDKWIIFELLSEYTILYLQSNVGKITNEILKYHQHIKD